MKIATLEVGKMCTIPLVVLSATSRETKAKKPYLSLELFDGEDSIFGNYWDWGGKNIPSKNAILNVSAQVTEWQGAKQLNIKSITSNTELHLSEFMPTSGHDVAQTYKDVYEIAGSIADGFYRNLALGLLDDLYSEWTTAPGAVSVHHAYTAGTLIHSLEVVKIARSMAEAIPGANMDLVTIGALLHDVGKLFGYKIDGIVCELTDDGKLLDHIYIGASYVARYASANCVPCDYAKLALLEHIILSHHGKLEHGAVVPPACLEAHIVHHADVMSAAAAMIKEHSKKAAGAKFTDRIWALENRPHLTQSYIEKVMVSTE